MHVCIMYEYNSKGADVICCGKLFKTGAAVTGKSSVTDGGQSSASDVAITRIT